MYPYTLFLDVDLYTLFFALGFVLCILYYRKVADYFDLSPKMQNFTMLSGLIGMLGGYVISVLFQALYNGLETGDYSVNEGTGATFYGGLLGGIAFFCISYFTFGHFFMEKGLARKQFTLTASIAAPAITIAHGCGRIGCLCAGCCHGKITDSWIGIWNEYLQAKTVPTQLFETIYLFLLCVFMTWLLVKKKQKHNFTLYMVAYAVFRFFIEYLRSDDRGASFIPFLSPSQLTAVLMFLFGIGIYVGEVLYAKKHPAPVETPAEQPIETLAEQPTETFAEPQENSPAEKTEEAQ